jgi:hypothetical protein
MAAYLLDINHASPLVTSGHPLQRKVYEQLFAGNTFGICVPVHTETVFGFSLLPRALQNCAQWERLYPLMTT